MTTACPPKGSPTVKSMRHELGNDSFFDNGVYVVSGHCIVSFTCLLIFIGCLSCPITTFLQAVIQVKLDSYSGVTTVKLTTKNKGS